MPGTCLRSTWYNGSEKICFQSLLTVKTRDIRVTSEFLSLSYWDRELEKAAKELRTPKLTKAIIKCYWKSYTILGIFTLIEVHKAFLLSSISGWGTVITRLLCFFYNPNIYFILMKFIVLLYTLYTCINCIPYCYFSCLVQYIGVEMKIKRNELKMWMS